MVTLDATTENKNRVPQKLLAFFFSTGSSHANLKWLTLFRWREKFKVTVSCLKMVFNDTMPLLDGVYCPLELHLAKKKKFSFFNTLPFNYYFM